MIRPARRNFLIAAVVLGGGCLLGGFLETGLQAEPQRPEDRLRTFGQVLALIEDNYVGEATSSEMVESAIEGLLRQLDPHSNYLNPDAFSEMRDEQRGKFYGLGIQIGKRGPEKPLTIIAPIDDTPADRAGLQAGDIIYKIEGDETIDLTIQQAVRRLKGDKGTKVTVTIKRPGLEDLFDVTLMRDEIPINSLRLGYMLDDRTGFIRIFNFTSTTARELDQAIAPLLEQGMERLILDLRENTGGLLEQAVQVSERFIPPGELIVYTRGRVPGSDQDYVARDGVDRLDLPLVVLVNQHSASASEIVSGAIQDHDRGLLVGQTTFGKGLVQRVIPLRNGGALAVTTAKYYTPSGRLIQRDYSDLESYYYDREEGGEVEPVETEPEDREVYHTSSGRAVYGGGGITPDYIVEPQPTSRLFSRLFRENIFFDFAVHYTAEHPDLQRGFRGGDELLQEFASYLDSRDFEYSREALEQGRKHIELKLRAQITRVKWDAVEESRVLARSDPLIQKALTLFDEAARLAQAGRQGGEPGPHAAQVELQSSSPTN